METISSDLDRCAPCGRCELDDTILLRICRITAEHPGVTVEWLADLRLAALLVGMTRAPADSYLEGAMALLAAVLGQLEQYNPVHLPFGWEGPTIQCSGWLDRDVLQRAGQQIAGLVWNKTDPEAVSVAIRQSVSRALRFGFLEQQDYDAWRPGMPSGSGWRSAGTATPYGITRARALANQKSNGKQTHEIVLTAAPACVQETSADAKAIVFASPIEDLKPPIQKAITAPAENEGQRATPANPAVQLGRRGEPCQVCGKNKRALTDAQYSVIQALQEAGEEGLTKDALEAVRPSARSILKNLRRDPDWASVILMPGQTNGRYRITM